MFFECTKYFFENKGICPTCKESLVINEVGCINWNCKECKKKRKINPDFDVKVALHKANFGVEMLISDTYHETLSQVNLDKG
jgi:predicted amidophosphoribosyltransferase